MQWPIIISDFFGGDYLDQCSVHVLSIISTAPLNRVFISFLSIYKYQLYSLLMANTLCLHLHSYVEVVSNICQNLTPALLGLTATNCGAHQHSLLCSQFSFPHLPIYQPVPSIYFFIYMWPFPCLRCSI